MRAFAHLLAVGGQCVNISGGLLYIGESVLVPEKAVFNRTKDECRCFWYHTAMLYYAL